MKDLNADKESDDESGEKKGKNDTALNLLHLTCNQWKFIFAASNFREFNLIL